MHLHPKTLTNILPGLPTVAEDEADEAQLQALAATAQMDVNDAARRTSAFTDISGTTAKTSFSQEEVAEMDADVILDQFPRLATTADDLAKFLAPSGDKTDPVLWKDIRISNTKEAKLYNRRLEAFETSKMGYGSQDYIQPRHILRALLGADSDDEITSGNFRPDNIIAGVNLATLLRVLLVTCEPSKLSDAGLSSLEQLETFFPAVISGPQFDMTTFQMCLEIQTQLAIARLAASSSDAVSSRRPN